MCLTLIIHFSVSFVFGFRQATDVSYGGFSGGAVKYSNKRKTITGEGNAMPEEKEKIILVQNNEPIKETKWSFRRYLTETWHYKWWVLGSTIALAVAGALGIEFFYNRSKTFYSTTFGLELPFRSVTNNGIRGPSYNLYDNSSFAATDFYNESVLQAVIDSSGEFSSLNAKQLASHGSLTVTGATNNGVFVAAQPYTLTLSFRAYDFKSSSQASSFITALIDYPIDLATKALSSHKAVTSFYDGFLNLDYVRQVEALNEKRTAIARVYSTLLESSRNASSLKLSDGKTTLGEAEESFRLSHIKDGAVDLSLYSGQLEANRFLSFTNTSEGIAAKIADLEAIAISELGNVKTSISSISTAEEAYKRLADTTNIVTTDSGYTTELLRLNRLIESETENLTASLSRLKRIGYSSGDPDLDILNIKTLAQAGKIAVLESSAPVKEWGYLQFLKNPTTDNWASNCAKFGETLKAAKAAYSSDINAVNEHFVYLSSAQSRSYIQTPSTISSSGGLALWVGAFAGLLLGFVSSSLVCTFVSIWKEDKQAKVLE